MSKQEPDQIDMMGEHELRAEFRKVLHELLAEFRKVLVELSATQQKLEAAEARIKASQEQEPHSRGNLGVLLYAAPVIPPDVAELQRENAELTRKLKELIAEK